MVQLFLRSFASIYFMLVLEMLTIDLRVNVICPDQFRGSLVSIHPYAEHFHCGNIRLVTNVLT